MSIKKRKILFIYRHDQLKDYFHEDGSFNGPKDFLWGMDSIDRDCFECHYINAPRLAKRIGIRRFTWLMEYPFMKITRIGFPIDIYILFYKKISYYDHIVCVNDAISLGILFWSLLGKIPNIQIHCIVMSLQERIKYFRQHKFIIYFISKLLRKADFLLTLSNSVHTEFVKDYKLDIKKVVTCYYGIDTNFWNPNESINKAKFILSVGNDMNRDYKTLIRAMPKGLHLKLVTKKQIDTLGKNVQVFRDWISDKDLRIMYNKAKLVVIPSIKLKNESSGLSCTLQALACKCIVIIPKLPTLMELFKEGVDCLYYEPENSSDLHDKINFVLQNRDICMEIAENGYKKVIQNYTVSHMGRELSDIIARA